MMRRSVLAVVALSLVAGLAAPASAQVFFNMDYSSSAYPNGGWNWGAVAEGPHFTRSLLPGAGPSGQNAVEVRHTPNDPMGQFYWGWAGVIEGADPGYGATRYYRWRMFFPNNINFAGGALGPVVNKLMIIGDGCGERCRVIVTYGPRTSLSDVNMSVQIDGGVDPISVTNLPKGRWLDIQVELRASSSSGSNNGGYKIWINNNNYSSPSAQVTNIQLHPAGWSLVKFGAYCNANLAANGVHNWRQTDFQAARSFDSAWASSGGALPTPQAPNNLRIIPPE